MNDHQRRVLGRVADEIAAYRAGSQSILDCLQRVYALYTAAELPPGADQDAFLDRYDAVSAEDDAIRLQELVPEVEASSERLDTALADLERWSLGLRDE